MSSVRLLGLLEAWAASRADLAGGQAAADAVMHSAMQQHPCEMSRAVEQHIMLQAWERVWRHFVCVYTVHCTHIAPELLVSPPSFACLICAMLLTTSAIDFPPWQALQ